MSRYDLDPVILKEVNSEAMERAHRSDFDVYAIHLKIAKTLSYY